MVFGLTTYNMFGMLRSQMVQSYVPATIEDNGILEIMLNESGLHTIRLDVIDWVGRMNSSTSQINVINSVPVLSMGLKAQMLLTQIPGNLLWVITFHCSQISRTLVTHRGFYFLLVFELKTGFKFSRFFNCRAR